MIVTGPGGMPLAAWVLFCVIGLGCSILVAVALLRP